MKTNKTKIMKKYKGWFDDLEYYDKHGKLPFEKTKVLISMSEKVKKDFQKFCEQNKTNMSSEIERLIEKGTKQ